MPGIANRPSYPVMMAQVDTFIDKGHPYSGTSGSTCPAAGTAPNKIRTTSCVLIR
jgi:hypothetical protein